jgi:hypothetical protein
MLPTYRLVEWSGAFFIIFLLFAHFFLWRLILAVSFSAFADHSKAQYQAQQRRSRAAFKAAFSLLQTGGYMPASAFYALAKGVRAHQPPEVAEIIFLAVGGAVGYINAQSFVA